MDCRRESMYAADEDVAVRWARAERSVLDGPFTPLGTASAYTTGCGPSEIPPTRDDRFTSVAACGGEAERARSADPWWPAEPALARKLGRSVGAREEISPDKATVVTPRGSLKASKMAASVRDFRAARAAAGFAAELLPPVAEELAAPPALKVELPLPGPSRGGGGGGPTVGRTNPVGRRADMVSEARQKAHEVLRPYQKGIRHARGENTRKPRQMRAGYLP